MNQPRFDRGHIWERDANGEINMHAHDAEGDHPGPRCTVCGYGYCAYCSDAPYEDCIGVLGVARRELRTLEDQLADWQRRILELPAEIATKRAEVGRLEALEVNAGDAEKPAPPEVGQVWRLNLDNAPLIDGPRWRECTVLETGPSTVVARWNTTGYIMTFTAGRFIDHIQAGRAVRVTPTRDQL